MTDSRIAEAAEKLRSLIAAIPANDWADRPWHTEECSDTDDLTPNPCQCIVAQGEYRDFDQPQTPLVQYVADAETREHAAYIAAMHPGVGAALADWLGCLAMHAPAERSGGECAWCGSNHAETVARALAAPAV